MRKTSLITFVAASLLASAAAFTSCKKDKTPEPAYQGVTINGVTWAKCNVASPGTFAASPESPGMFYQWNRIAGWPAAGGITDWNPNTPPGESWESAKDPCPSGWRVPTKDEQVVLLDAANVEYAWDALRGGGIFTDKTSKKSIFLPAVGQRNGDTLDYVGSDGFYWSSSSGPMSSAWLLYFSSDDAGEGYSGRKPGFSVRCVRQ